MYYIRNFIHNEGNVDEQGERVANASEMRLYMTLQLYSTPPLPKCHLPLMS